MRENDFSEVFVTTPLRLKMRMSSRYIMGSDC